MTRLRSVDIPPGAGGGGGGGGGSGLPTGGTANQVLTKIDSTNYNAQWSTDLIVGNVTASGRVEGGVFSLTDAPSIAVNAALGNTARVTLGGNRTLANPTNPGDGQNLVIEVTQDGTGSRTLAFDTAYVFSTTIPSVTLSTVIGAIDEISFKYNQPNGVWRIIGFVPGFAL